MPWKLIVANRAQKNLKRFPDNARNRIIAALNNLAEDPFIRGVIPLKGSITGFRLRVGDYRILFDINTDEVRIEVRDITRRTTQTYRRR